MSQMNADAAGTHADRADHPHIRIANLVFLARRSRNQNNLEQKAMKGTKETLEIFSFVAFVSFCSEERDGARHSRIRRDHG
jgi:hypothetical protein